jgi:hypothetical protein
LSSRQTEDDEDFSVEARPYTEYDLVFKAPDPQQLVSLYQGYYRDTLEEDPPQGLRGEVNKLAQRAQPEKSSREIIRVHSPGFDFDLYYDPRREEYGLIKPDIYSAANLLYVLFDCLVEHPQGDPEALVEEACLTIDRYLGRIEDAEGQNFARQSQELKTIAAEMIQTMALLDEQDFNEKDLEKLADQIDKNYYEPLGMILQSILIDIEKAPGN